VRVAYHPGSTVDPGVVVGAVVAAGAVVGDGAVVGEGLLVVGGAVIAVGAIAGAVVATGAVVAVGAIVSRFTCSPHTSTGCALPSTQVEVGDTVGAGCLSPTGADGERRGAAVVG
jgi:hypothetical protein